MKRMKKLGNKGFSLIELIIVVAIMAILIGALAPQYLKYVERTRRAQDIQTADAIRSAVQVAIADKRAGSANSADNYKAATYSYTTDINIATATGWLGSVKEVIGAVTMQSTGYSDFSITISDTGQVTVSITGTGKTTAQIAPPPTANTAYDDFKAGK